MSFSKVHRTSEVECITAVEEIGSIRQRGADSATFLSDVSGRKRPETDGGDR